MTEPTKEMIEAGLKAAHRSWYGNPSFDDAVRAAIVAAYQVQPPTDADMRAFGASHVACYKWPDAGPEHSALRAAYCEGAADAVQPAMPDREEIAQTLYKKCTCGQSGHGNAHEPGCPLSSYAGPVKSDRDQRAFGASHVEPSHWERDATGQETVRERLHVYLSTACFHGLHDRCRKQCKFCDVACRCYCHDKAATAAPTPVEGEWQLVPKAAVRCMVTGNQFGTDTWMVGRTCPCKVCQTMLAAAPAPPFGDGWLTDSDLYYLRSIKRQMLEVRSALADEASFSLGGEAFADNIDWLDCFIEKHERPLPPPPNQGDKL